MRSLCSTRLPVTAFILVQALALSLCVKAQDNLPQKLAPTKTPLTNEQIEVYRAVLEDYRHGEKLRLNVDDLTELPLEADVVCAKFKPENDSLAVVHRLDARVAREFQIELVDAESQQKHIADNDPQNLVKGAIDEGKHVTDEQLDNAVRTAFAGGLFTFSEIGFDRGHRRAIVSYSFVCGSLCGHGNTLILEKTGGKWKVKKQCGGWVS